MGDSNLSRQLLQISIAQVCQNIGWHAAHNSPMDILNNVLQRYVTELAKCAKSYCNQYNRIEPNLDDLGLCFTDFSLNLPDIEEYVNNVEPVPPIFKSSNFPVKHKSNLQYPKHDSRELLVRPEHIPQYLPLMHPDLEEESNFNTQSVIDGIKKDVTNGDSPLDSPKNLKRIDWPSEISNKSKSRFSEEEGRPMREVTSVFMTPAGFISPVHEGKVPEAALPCLVDSPPLTPETPAFTASKKDLKSKDIKREKSKSKKDKDVNRKDSKKIKSLRKEKENKENATNKHDKSITPSSSKKEHTGSHKTSKSGKNMKSEETVRQKIKSDKMKLKAQKEDIQKAKDSFKVKKIKSKLKHSIGSGSSSHVKSSKLSSSKKLKAAKLAKSLKHFKIERNTLFEPDIVLPLATSKTGTTLAVPKEVPFESKPPVVESTVETVEEKMDIDDDDLDFREESPESRLVIDDSLETQARQEKESRQEVYDKCIEAVIRHGEEESEIENKAMDDSINIVARGPPGMRKLEPKDIYDFTDTSNSSSLSSDLEPHSPVHTPTKKEKRTSDSSKKSSESPKKNKKEKKKKGKDLKSRSPEPYMSPKSQKSSNFILRTDDRTPSPILKDDLLSSDGSTPSSSPRSNSYFDQSPQRSSHIQSSPSFSHIPSHQAPFGSSNFSSSPFAPMRNMPGQPTPNFQTPPLFVSKGESSMFQGTLPLNLAKSGSSSLKTSPNKSDFNSKEVSDVIKKAANILEKSKVKEHKKEKGRKKGKKEVEKAKDIKEDIKDKEDDKKKGKAKEKPKSKTSKVDRRKSKPEKKKAKEKELKEDSTVPKMTLKLSSGAGSTKIIVKPNTKHSTSLSSNSSQSDEDENMLEPSSPTPPPSPPRDPTPPPRVPTPSPPSPPPREKTPSPVPPPPISSKTPTSRGRGRGKKAAAQVVVPPARTVITETVGTIVDESGNKIWICPACSRADDGSAMIGCDECDDWYHWVCVGIVVPPKEEENWFCTRCISKRQAPAAKRRRKKHNKK